MSSRKSVSTAAPRQNLSVSGLTRTRLDGRTLTDGNYNYQVRVIDTAGNIGATASQIVTVDTTAPLASKTIAIAGISDDTGLSSSDFVTRDTTLTVRGTLGAALAADERAQISLDGGVTDHVNRYRHQLELCRWSHTDRRHLELHGAGGGSGGERWADRNAKCGGRHHQPGSGEKYHHYRYQR
ncbi:hypothetical protein ECZU20_30600 [Escherichia coli]|nr:hypothetical protein ECZU20_30600 [Escherichia coli]